MSVVIEKEKVILKGEEGILKQNLTKIEALNNNAFFNHKFTNKIGRDLVYYMCNSMHYNLSNPEPVNLERNTLSKTFSVLKVIDDGINKPLNQYDFNLMNNFIRDFTTGKIKGRGNKEINPKTISYYVGEFKRLWKIYRQYELHNNSESFNELFFDWGMNLKAPKVKREYEDFPTLSIKELIELSENLHNEEYKVRTLVSVNLMGRKCEIRELKYKDLDIKKDGMILIKLPHVKKHSTEKTSVELFTFVKKELNKYLSHNEFKPNDYLFPSRGEAYAKNLKSVSMKLFGLKINPKTLRKIGLSVSDELGFSRSDTERIGGWSANSPVIAHYFNRKKPVLANEKDDKIENDLNKDLNVELEKLKVENQQLHEKMEMVLKYMAERGDFKGLNPQHNTS